MSIKVFALVGLSGSGKSLLSRRLRELGYEVIDCDRVVRDLQQPGTACWNDMKAAFPGVFSGDSFDRRELGRQCYANDEKMKHLNSIVHPRVREELILRFEALAEDGKECCFIEAPTLFESGIDSLCDLIILVKADREVSINRIMKRDGMTREEAAARLDAQIPVTELEKKVDLIIDNSKEIEDLDIAIDRMCEYLDVWIRNRGNSK